MTGKSQWFLFFPDSLHSSSPDTMRTGPQGGGFPFRSRSIPPSPVPEVCIVVNNMVLISFAGRHDAQQQKPILIWSLGTPLTNNSQGFSCLALEFSFRSSWERTLAMLGYVLWHGERNRTPCPQCHHVGGKVVSHHLVVPTDLRYSLYFSPAS